MSKRFCSLHVFCSRDFVSYFHSWRKHQCCSKLFKRLHPANNVYVWTLNNALIFFIIALFFFIFWLGKFRIWCLFLELASPTLLCLLFSYFTASLRNRTSLGHTLPQNFVFTAVCPLLFDVALGKAKMSLTFLSHA